MVAAVNGNSGSGGSGEVNNVDHSHDVKGNEGTPPTGSGGSTNTVETSGTTTPSGSPANGNLAQQSTNPTEQPGWTPEQKEAEKRKILTQNPAYINTCSDLATLDDETIVLLQRAELLNMGVAEGKGDDQLWIDDLNYAINSPTFTAAEKAKLTVLRDNPRIWSQLQELAKAKGSSQGIRISDLATFQNQLKATKTNLESNADAAVSSMQTPKNKAPETGSSKAPEPKTWTPEQLDAEKKRLLDGDPEYQDLTKQQALIEKGLQGALLMLDHNNNDLGGLDGIGTRGDGLVSVESLTEAATESYLTPEQKALIAEFLSSPLLQQLLASSGVSGRVKVADVVQAFAQLKAKMKVKEDAATQNAKSNMAAGQQPPTSSTGGTSGTDKKEGTPPPKDPNDIVSQVPKPTPSTKAGMEGAMENLNNAQDYLQNAIMKLAEEAAKNPEKAQALNARISMMQNQLQAIGNMISQMMNMISNLSKLWSDVAMNAIRNMK